jgi:predicted nucleic acid-binding protein
LRACFFDTWSYLAIANRRDPYHELAVEADRALEEAGFAAVTSDYVLDETLTGLHVAAGARVALQFVELLQASIDAEELLLLDVSPPRRESALEVFRRLAPQVPRISFTDCTSIALMQELEIEVAFSADRHFHRGGKGIRPLFEEHRGRLTLRLPTA